MYICSELYIIYILYIYDSVSGSNWRSYSIYPVHSFILFLLLVKHRVLDMRTHMGPSPHRNKIMTILDFISQLISYKTIGSLSAKPIKNLWALFIKDKSLIVHFPGIYFFN